MHRTDAPGHVGNLFSAGNPSAGQMPTQLDKDWHNAVQEEVCRVIEQAGIALVKGTNTQLHTAILALISNGQLTAAQILARLITVDGAGSGLDAAMLGGQLPSYYGNPVGTIIKGLWASPPSGYLKIDGGSVGNAASGATSRANADCAALFAVLWALDPAVAVIQTSGGGATLRGASAAVDFAANKIIIIPDFRSGFARAWDDGRGLDAGRLLGSWQEDEFESHTHQYGFVGGALATGNSAGPIGATAYSDTGARGGTETRPKNFSALFCIKY